MTATTSILTITDLLDTWRTMGSRRLRNGTELIGRVPVDDGETWLHAVFPAIGETGLASLERQLGRPLPASLRTFYRCVGGLSVFAGLFEVCGLRPTGWTTGDLALQPRCLVALNHELDALQWMPAGAVAFASNQWDLSVHLLVPAAGDVVARCDRRTGRVIETHANVLEAVAARLLRLDQMVVR